MRSLSRYTTSVFLFSSLLCSAAVVQGASVEVLIDGALHPLGDPLRAALMLPEGASAQNPVPGCLVVHGSGGLFHSNNPGEACGPELVSGLRELGELLVELGVASLLPSSFVSRDPRFCGDYDDSYFQFVAPPFHNPGDGIPTRDVYYDIRRTVTRPLDLLAATDYLCAREEVDCDRICMVGISNGGTSVMSYVANDLQRHMDEYVDIGLQREYESDANFQNRQIALANFPSVPDNVAERLAERVLPRFAQIISPACGLRGLIPIVVPYIEEYVNDLYYPAGSVELHLDIGTADDVPESCYNGGIRQLQVWTYEALTNASRSRYLVETYEGAGHNLLESHGNPLHAKLSKLVNIHFFSKVFQNGFE